MDKPTLSMTQSILASKNLQIMGLFKSRFVRYKIGTEKDFAEVPTAIDLFGLEFDFKRICNIISASQFPFLFKYDW